MSFKIYKLYVRVLFKTLAKPHEFEEFYEIFQNKLDVKDKHRPFTEKDTGQEPCKVKCENYF